MTTVLITGANRGIGLELAKRYAARGDSVLACCREPAAADALGAIDGAVEVLALDVGSDASVAALAEKLSGRTVDLVINNAGTLGPAYDQQTATKMDFDGWLDAFNINSIGPVRVMHALMPNLKASSAPRVATITSQMGALSLDMNLGHGYSASKAALNKFMKLAAIDLAGDGISVCVIHPGWVRTDMGGPDADISPEESADGIVATIDKLTPETSGSFWKWNGEEHGW